MLSPKQKLADYVEKLIGVVPRFEPQPAQSTSLPLYLREHYELSKTKLFGAEFILAFEREDWEPGSAGEYATHATKMAHDLGESVVLVLSQAPSPLRDRLVQHGVPFIVPGNQFFVPFLAADLREWIPRVKPAPGKHVSAVAQLLLIFHLVRESMEKIPLREIAKRLGYSPMMISTAKDELEAAGIAEPTREKRTVVLHFLTQGWDLWNKAQPWLSSPVRKRHWVQWKNPGYPAIAAGITALSKKTNLEDDPVPTYALVHSNVRRWFEKGVFTGCTGRENANAQIEEWIYNPLLLGNDEVVDPCSLFLSLRDSPDERVQQQLTRLLESLPW
jgi:DNA-binding MarR family transcriptional regulator